MFIENKAIKDIMFLSRRVFNSKVFSKYSFCQVKPPILQGNYYDILGVQKDANKETIIQKYKELGIFNLNLFINLHHS